MPTQKFLLQTVNSINNLDSEPAATVPRELVDWIQSTVDILNTNIEAIQTAIQALQV